MFGRIHMLGLLWSEMLLASPVLPPKSASREASRPLALAGKICYRRRLLQGAGGAQLRSVGLCEPERICYRIAAWCGRLDGEMSSSGEIGRGIDHKSGRGA